MCNGKYVPPKVIDCKFQSKNQPLQKLLGVRLPTMRDHDLYNHLSQTTPPQIKSRSFEMAIVCLEKQYPLCKPKKLRVKEIRAM